MRKLLPLLLLAGLALPLIGCGKEDEPKMDDAKTAVDDTKTAVDDAADAADKHGTGAGAQDHTGDGGAKGGGTKHE